MNKFSQSTFQRPSHWECRNDVSAERRGWRRYLYVFSLLLYFFGFPSKSAATLIIAIRHNDEMCLASDGLLSNQHQQISGHYVKCFRSSDTSCVTISGFGGAEVTIKTNTPINVSFPEKLEQIASEESAKHQQVLQTVTNILNRFTSVYSSFMSWKPIVNARRNNFQSQFYETDLYFFAYDSKTFNFCEFAARYAPDAPDTFQLDTILIPTNSIGFEGESEFLATLMTGADPDLTRLRSKEITGSILTPLSDNNAFNLRLFHDGIFQLYAIHNQYAQKYHRILVGPPYVVYRISTTNVSRVYYGNGGSYDDAEVVGVLICGVVIILIVALVAFALRT